MDVKGKLVELLKDAQIASVDKCHTYEECKSCPNDGQGMLCRVPFSVDHLIANGVTVQEWIPVTERLPEPKESPVLVSRISGVCIAWRLCNCWVLPSGIKTIRVTHWMPLPQPPKMGGGAENG